MNKQTDARKEADKYSKDVTFVLLFYNIFCLWPHQQIRENRKIKLFTVLISPSFSACIS